MLPLSQIAEVRATVDAHWRSPGSDAVGGRWDIPAGVLRYWRSSAAHVFVIPHGGDERGVLYARFAPAGSTAGARLRRGGQLHARLSDAGASVASLVRSRADEALELIPTPLGEMVACVVRRADGEELDVDELDASAFAAWGTALARFHQDAGPAESEEGYKPSHVFARLVSSPDQDLADAARVRNALLESWEPGPLVMGHGGFAPAITPSNRILSLQQHACSPTRLAGGGGSQLHARLSVD